VAYSKTGSAAGVSKLLDIDRTTVVKYLRSAKIPTRAKGDFTPRQPNQWGEININDYGCVAKWIVKHPGLALPRSPKAIAIVTGCSEDAVKSWLRRRRRQTEVHIRMIPDLRKYKLKFESQDNKWYYTSDIESYQIGYDKYSLHLTVNAIMRELGSTRVVFKVRDPEQLLAFLKAADNATISLEWY
jgi:hypothetical protein